MKASELRIGNLVFRINREKNIHFSDPFPMKVWQVGIFNSEILHLDDRPESNEWIKVSNTNLDPIPLTPEWLEKFGFEHKKYGRNNQYDFHIFDSRVIGLILRYEIIEPHKDKAYYQGHTKMLLTDDYAEGFEDIDITETCKYVHQLQNLYFALTGKELTIALQ